MLWFHPKEIMSQINICFTRGTEALSNTVGQLQLSSAWTCLFLNFSLLTQVHSEQLAPWLYRGHNLAWMHWTGKKVSGRSPGGVHSNGEHWALHGTGTCQHLLGHVPLFALINVGLDKQAGVYLKGISAQQEGWASTSVSPLLRITFSARCAAAGWTLVSSLSQETMKVPNGTGTCGASQVPGHSKTWTPRDTEGAKCFRHDSAWIVLLRL